MELNDERYDDHDEEEDDNEDKDENDAFVSTKGELSYTNT